MVFDHRAGFARPERFPGAARVVSAVREKFAAAGRTPRRRDGTLPERGDFIGRLPLRQRRGRGAGAVRPLTSTPRPPPHPLIRATDAPGRATMRAGVDSVRRCDSARTLSVYSETLAASGEHGA